MVCSGHPPHSAWWGQMGSTASGDWLSRAAASASIKEDLRRSTRAFTLCPGKAFATNTTVPLLVRSSSGARRAMPRPSCERAVISSVRCVGAAFMRPTDSSRLAAAQVRLGDAGFFWAANKGVAPCYEVVYSRHSRKSRTVVASFAKISAKRALHLSACGANMPFSFWRLICTRLSRPAENSTASKKVLK